MVDDLNLSRRPKDVRIEELYLISNDDIAFNIYNMIEEIQIYESIDSSLLSGNLSFLDSLDLPKNLRLTGGEKILIKFKAAGRNRSVRLVFTVYKISDRFQTKEKLSGYVMYFTSTEAIYDSVRKVSKSYQGSCNEILSDILRNNIYGLQTLKQVNVSEPTQFFRTFVFPNWCPLKCIRWMTNRTISQLFPNSAFKFFENKKGFVFSSLENLFNQEPKATYVSSQKLMSSLSQRDLEKDHRIIERYDIVSSFDLIKGLRNGAYGSRLYTFDLHEKSYKRLDYFYDESFGLDTEQSTTNVIQKQFEEINLHEQYDAKVMLDVKHSFVHDNEQNDSYSEIWKRTQTSQNEQLGQTVLELYVPGDEQINCGDIIEVKIPSTGASENTREEDPLYSGRFLVMSASHHLKQDEYSMILEVMKITTYTPVAVKQTRGTDDAQ